MHCRKSLPLLTLIAVLTAPAAPAAADGIAVIDVQRILVDSSAGRIARDLLEQSSKRAQETIERMRLDLENLQKQYEGQRAILKEDARQALETQILEKQMELRQTLQQTQIDLQQRDAELTEAILAELKPIIADLAAQRGLTLVLEKGEAGVLFNQDKLDLTDIVLKRYDDSKRKPAADTAK